MKKVLITGAGSYIGMSVEKWLNRPRFAGMYQVDTVDMKENEWKKKEFFGYDTVFHVAGIVHADIGRVEEKQKKLYYAVNCDLAVEAAKKAKREGVSQFIYMSSIIVYGEGTSVRKKRIITRETKPSPSNFYGDSKWEAEQKLSLLCDKQFHVAILRPPMIYGEGCKGNYQTLRKIAIKAPVFPDFPNERSMLYIGNLCEFVRLLVEEGSAGTFFPQNSEYVKTAEMVRQIGKRNNNKIHLVKGFNWGIYLMGYLPGKIGRMVNKAFGSLVYEPRVMQEPPFQTQKSKYQIYKIEKSIKRTEKKCNKRKTLMGKNIWIIDHYSSEPAYAGISRQYDFARELANRGHHVVVIASSFSHFTHSYISNEEKFESKVNEKVHFVYLRTSAYASNGGIGRLKNMLSFLQSVRKHTERLVEKYGSPDVVTGCSVHPFAWMAAYQISKKYSCRFCVEVRDFWPGIWVWGGEKSKYHPMVLFFGALERWAYRKADRIIYSMRYGNRYICDELGFSPKKAFLIGQPMDCDRYDRNSAEKKNLLPEEIKTFAEGKFICTFAGYYMTYEGVYTMLEAAEKLQNRKIPVRMIFVGSGQEEEKMRRFADEHRLKNVYIGGRIPKETIPALLRMSDICMAHLQVEKHEGVYKYGVSKNKVIEYLYSGACTLYGFTDKNDWVAESGAGYVFTPYSSEELADMIEKVYHMTPAERKQFGECGKQFIEQNHKVQILTEKLENVLLGE